jgi:hypothetical protein
MIINVTQEHIDKGEAGRCSKCPIALAIQEQTKYVGARVDRIKFYKSEIDLLLRLGKELPVEAVEFILWFDSRMLHRIKPFSFELHV